MLITNEENTTTNDFSDQSTSESGLGLSETPALSLSVNSCYAYQHLIVIYYIKRMLCVCSLFVDLSLRHVIPGKTATRCIRLVLL